MEEFYLNDENAPQIVKKSLLSKFSKFEIVTFIVVIIFVLLWIVDFITRINERFNTNMSVIKKF